MKDKTNIEKLKRLFQIALEKDLEIRLYNYDSDFSNFITVTFNHLKDVTNNAATIRFGEWGSDGSSKPFYFYYHKTPKNKTLAKIVKDILFAVANIQQGFSANYKTKYMPGEIKELFDEHKKKMHSIFLIKYDIFPPQTEEEKKSAFVRELGALFNRYGVNNINSTEINFTNESVKIYYKSGLYKKIDIACDNMAGIVKDLVRQGGLD